MPLPGSCQWPLPCLLSVPFSKSGSFRRPALPGVFSTPSLSATLPARPAPHGVPVCACTLLCRASRVAPFSIFRTCRHHYPGGNGSVLLSLVFPNRRRPSPGTRRVGSHIAVFEACSMFTHVPTHAVAELLNATLCHRSASVHVAPSMSRPGCYQPKTTIVGWASHPTRKTRLSTAHGEFSLMTLSTNFKRVVNVLGGAEFTEYCRYKQRSGAIGVRVCSGSGVFSWFSAVLR